jgi:hypothetical protein
VRPTFFLFCFFLLSKQRYFYEGNWAGVEQPANESQQPEDPSDAFPDAAVQQEPSASADEEVLMGVVLCQRTSNLHNLFRSQEGGDFDDDDMEAA